MNDWMKFLQPLSVFSTCQVARCQLLILFPVCNLDFFCVVLQPCCGTLPGPASSDKASVVYLLQIPHGNSPDSLFFSVISNFHKIRSTLRWKPDYSLSSSCPFFFISLHCSIFYKCHSFSHFWLHCATSLFLFSPSVSLSSLVMTPRAAAAVSRLRQPRTVH